MLHIQVVERYFPEELDDCNNKVPPIMAFCRHGTDLPWHLDKDNWLVAENLRTSILMVPESANPSPSVVYNRIMVPLDGSCRAEAALPVAEMAAR